MKGLGIGPRHRWVAWVLSGVVAWMAAGCAGEVATPTVSLNLSPESVKESQTQPVKLAKFTGARTETIFVGWPDERPQIKRGQKVSQEVLQQLAALGNRPPEDLNRVQITLDLTARNVAKPYSPDAALLVSLTNPEYNELAIPVGSAATGSPLTVHETWTFDRQTMLTSVPGNWQVQLQTGELTGVEYKITVQAERGQPSSASESVPTPTDTMNPTAAGLSQTGA